MNLVWLGQQLAKRVRQLVDVALLVEESVEQDAVARRQVSYWLVEIGLPPANRVEENPGVIVTEARARNVGVPRVLHDGLDDVRAPNVGKPRISGDQARSSYCFGEIYAYAHPALGFLML